MALNVLRGVFVLLIAAAGWSYVTLDPSQTGTLGGVNWLALAVSLVLGVAMVAIDILSGRRKFAVFTGIAFGVLVGLTITYALSFGVTLVIDNVVLPNGQGQPANLALASFLNLLIGTISCYFAISFILQTKDDFRFIIPYVEFRRDARGSRPIVVDTSVLIDGRIIDVLDAGFLDGRLIVPQFVVLELQHVADSDDRSKGERGRRGLDVLTTLRRNPQLDVRVYDTQAHNQDDLEVDVRLTELAKTLDAKALTVDYNLAKVARLSGVEVLNLNELASGLRHDAIPGETVRVAIEKKGTGQGQGVGRLEDGTMVIVENASERVGQTLDAIVSNTTQTNAGRLVFARVDASVDTPAAASDESNDDDSEDDPPGGQVERYTKRRKPRRSSGKSRAKTT